MYKFIASLLLWRGEGALAVGCIHKLSERDGRLLGTFKEPPVAGLIPNSIDFWEVQYASTRAYVRRLMRHADVWY